MTSRPAPLLRRAACLGIAAGALLLGCSSEKERSEGAALSPPAPSAPPAPATPDRLPPGELLEGEISVHGLMLPRRMVVERQFSDATHAVGPVDPTLLSAYLKRRVHVAHVELVGRKFVFPRATILGNPQEVFRIEVLPEGDTTRLVLRNITPKPRTEGLTEAERWERAGLTPGGELRDPNELK